MQRVGRLVRIDLPMTRFLFLSLLALSFTPLSASVIHPFFRGRSLPYESAQEHYSEAVDAHEEKRWDDLILQSLILKKNFKETEFAREALYFLGVGYFERGDMDMANRHFTSYLKSQATPRYFEQAIRYKFEIAKQFHTGARGHLFGWEAAPQWVPTHDEALKLYDEVVAALPQHDLAAEALYLKGELLLYDDEFKSSLETYQQLIRRFPKHPLAAESFLAIAEVHLKRAAKEYPDLDYLDLAEINLRKFAVAFPGDSRLEQAKEKLIAMKEEFAKALFEIGSYYQRTKKKNAAIIYYTKVLASYPETPTAEKVRKVLPKLGVDPDRFEVRGEELAHQIEEPTSSESVFSVQ